LSRRRIDWTPEQEAAAAKEEESSSPTPMGTPSDLKGGLGQSGPLFGDPNAGSDG
jgi:hypothetical protein